MHKYQKIYNLDNRINEKLYRIRELQDYKMTEKITKVKFLPSPGIAVNK